MQAPRHVIVVDDDGAIGALIVRIIRGIYADVEVSYVAGGGEALQLFDRRGADLVLTDYDMPAMTGLELIAHLRARSATLPIILLTAYGQIIATAKQAGANATMMKPFSIDQLRRTVTSLLPV